MKRMFAIVIGILMVALLYYCNFVRQDNPLRKYGVEYSVSHGEHYSVVIIKFTLQTKEKKVKGPTFSGDELRVDFVDSDKDGVGDIIVKSGIHPGHYAKVKLLIKDGVATGFHIMENHSMCIGFPAEGYFCP